MTYRQDGKKGNNSARQNPKNNENNILQYRRAERRKQNILDEIQELRADKLFPSVALDGMPKGSGQADLSDFVVLMSDYIAKLKEERLQKIKIRIEINKKMKDLFLKRIYLSFFLLTFLFIFFLLIIT